MKKLKELCFFAKYLSKKGLISGSEGNLSIREKEGLWITPSGKIKEILTPEDLCFINWEGNFITAQPSSEWGMHYKIYLKNPSANAIVHTHPLFTLVLDFCNFDFKKFSHFEGEILLGEIKVIPYLKPGSLELWESVSELAKDSKAIVLSKHGVVTWGKSLEEAVNLTLILEKMCKIEYLKRIWR
ncbi:MAG: class II aldolase [Thermodesulfobacterium geofontis]|uniref:Class II aldolase n=1 Tax=Thermodesulfobacterium geofontis TaxID=1295609 RepID=A0A2N7PMJ9_9BACT|nr:MAG: class II aldolase [Thermodesulfobacterium geofontis]